MTKARACFHCGLPVPEKIHLIVEITAQPREMCCAGCQAVAQSIVDNHLEDFYNHRTERSTRAESLIPEQLRQMQLYDDEKLQASFVHHSSEQAHEAALILEGITCAACVWLNERHIKALPGVLSFNVNYSTHRAQLCWDPATLKLSDVLKAISEIGYQAHPFDPGRQEELHKKERSQAIRRLGVAGVGMMQVMMMAVAMYLGDHQGMSDDIRRLLRWASLIVTAPVMLYSAFPFFRSAWRDVSHRQLGMDVPVSIAIGLAFIASAFATLGGTGEVYFDSVVMFTFFLLLGRFLELNARHRAGQVADELVKLMPATAYRKSANGLEPVPVTELQTGDVVVVRSGDSVPADGAVLEGQSSVDESLLTGESLPVEKSPGDTLIGGTINRASALTMRVDQLGQDTVLASISRILERAQSDKPQIALLANRISGWFVAAVLVISAAVLSYWSLQGSPDAFWIMLSVLVVTCPCALSLATPVAMTAAISVLTELGVLTTRGHALETMARVTDVVFDKTGTLTQGHIEVLAVEVVEGVAVKEFRQIAAGLEAYSEHPIAQAVRGLEQAGADVEIIESETGQGILGRYHAELYRIGNLDYIQGWHRDYSAAASPAGSAIYLANQSQVLGRILLGDQVRDQSASALGLLREQGVSLHLLSGDNAEAVRELAQMLDIEHALSRQMPDAKLAYVRKLQAEGRVVAMIGDGVNDAPVLAGADVSIAMGGGAQLAQASADMVLLSDELDRIPRAMLLSRKTLTIIRQNLGWAIGYNLIALPLAAMGYIAPWMAAIGMSFSSLLVILNALRLRDRRRI